jgi:polysaccharide export outer membrane protein
MTDGLATFGRGAALLCLMLMVLASGCVPNYTDHASFIRRPKPLVGQGPYILEPPDAVRIVAPSAPEIHDQVQALRFDGFITLHLVGDIFAAGKTPAQLGAEIEERILRYYEDVSVEVVLVAGNSKKYYVAGTQSAGARPYNARITLLDVTISSTGDPRAWPEKIVIIRPNEDPELIRRATVNVKQMVEMGLLRDNFIIEEGDIVFIPLNPLAAVGQGIANLLQPIQPAVQVLQAPATLYGVPARVGGTYEGAGRQYQ